MPSVELATAYVSLVPSFEGVTSKVAKALRPADGVAAQVGRSSGDAYATGFESRTSKIAARLGNVLKAGVATATAAVGAAGVVGIRTAAQLEQSEIAFTTMLGSGQKARAFLSDLSKFAAKTPFDLPGLQDSASSLISIGLDASKVIPIMTTLGNVTSGMGTGSEGIKRATIAIQQMNAAQKISAEDLNQLRDAGIPVYDLLTAATGKTTAQIAEMRDKGQLGREELEALMSALETGKGFERFNGLMEAQSQSLSGLWSTAKDTFSVGMAEAIKPVIPLLKDGLGAGISFLSSTALPGLKTGLSATVTGLAGFTSNLQTFAAGVISGALTPDLVKALGLDPSQGFGMVLGEAIGGIRAFGAAWKYNDGEVTSSGFPGFMERAAYWTRQMWDSVAQLDFTSFLGFLSSVNASGGQAGSTIASVGDSLSRLWPAVQEFASQVPDFAGIGLKLLVEGLAFLADHVDTIIAWMPAIVAAFVAWKVATVAITVAQLAAVPAQIALNVTRIQAANAERGLAAAHRMNTAAQLQAAGAERVTLGTRLKNTAAAIAQRTAVIAASVATKAAAAGQWLLNAAMSANPIGIIIIAVTALVGALVWFFTQTELGRKIVTGAWKAIQVGIAFVVGWFRGTAVPWLEGAISNVTGAFSSFRDGVISRFNAVKALIAAVWNATLRPVFERFGSIVRGLPGAFTAAKDGIGRAWSKVQDLAKKPVRFVVDTVINKGLIGTFNKIPGVNIPEVKLPKGFAKGGLARGWAVVGEEGPELVNFARPGRVYTAKQSAGMLHADSAAHAASGGSVSGAFMGSVNAIRKSGAYFLKLAAGLGPWNFPGAARMWDGAAGVRVRIGTGRHQGYVSAAERGGGILGYTTGTNIDMSPSWMARLGAVQRRTVAAHEIGHALGLPHMGGASIMQAALGNMASVPTPKDIRTLQRLYPGGSGKAGTGVPENPFAELIGKWLQQIKSAFPAGGLFADAAGGLAKQGIESVIKFVANIGSFVSDVVGGVVGAIKGFFGGGASTAPTATVMDGGGMLYQGMNLIEHRRRKPDRVLSDSQWKTMERIAVNSEPRSSGSQRPIEVYTNDPHAAAVAAARLISSGV